MAGNGPYLTPPAPEQYCIASHLSCLMLFVSTLRCALDEDIKSEISYYRSLPHVVDVMQHGSILGTGRFAFC